LLLDVAAAGWQGIETHVINMRKRGGKRPRNWAGFDVFENESLKRLTEDDADRQRSPAETTP